MRKAIILYWVFLAPQLWGATWEVCNSCQFNTISSAIENASSGDSILVHFATYKEGNIVIEKSLYLIGLNMPVVDGENETEVFTIFADNVTLSGFQIQNVGISYTVDRAGIRVVKSKGTVISDNRIINTFFGIYLQKASDCTIRNNEIAGQAKMEISSGNAIHLWYCKNMNIANNIVTGHRDGIYLEFVDDSEITGNVSEGNIRYGLHFMFSNRDNYIGNAFRNNGAGVAVMFSRNIVMDSNHFEKNWGTTSYALLLKEIYDGEIINNVFTSNTTAIYGESATRLIMQRNVFKQNGWALRLLGSSMDNTIEQNNFINNTFDVATNSSRNYNTYVNNYWDKYSGYDLNKDNIGDVPYHPVKLFSYIITRSESSIVLLRSFFVDILDFVEKIAPEVTPVTLIDEKPLMRPVSL